MDVGKFWPPPSVGKTAEASSIASSSQQVGQEHAKTERKPFTDIERVKQRRLHAFPSIGERFEIFDIHRLCRKPAPPVCILQDLLLKISIVR